MKKTTTTTTLEAIQPQMMRLALSLTNGDTDKAADLVGLTSLYILERGRQNEEPTYILQQLKWQAFGAHDTEKAYSKRVSPLSGTMTDDDGDEMDWQEYTADPSMTNPEDLCIEAEAAADFNSALNGLDAQAVRIINLLDRGFSYAEISRKMGVSRAAVTQKVARIRAELASS